MRVVSLFVTPALALAVSCGGGDGGEPLRDPTVDDLSKMVLQRDDLPDGFAQVQVCEGQNPLPSTDTSVSVTFFEMFDIGSAERTTCVVSYVFLLPSLDEASRSLRALDEFFAYANQPIEQADGECSPFHEIDGPLLGEETRVFTVDCAFCPADAAPIYWNSIPDRAPAGVASREWKAVPVA
jgi:hypothetical protein